MHFPFHAHFHFVLQDHNIRRKRQNRFYSLANLLFLLEFQPDFIRNSSKLFLLKQLAKHRIIPKNDCYCPMKRSQIAQHRWTVYATACEGKKISTFNETLIKRTSYKFPYYAGLSCESFIHICYDFLHKF